MQNVKLASLAWLFVLIVGLASFTYSQRVKLPSQALKDAEQNSLLLGDLTRQCKSTLDYNRQYNDMSDVQVIRALNAEALRCQSLQNQATAAQLRYQQLSNQ